MSSTNRYEVSVIEQNQYQIFAAFLASHEIAAEMEFVSGRSAGEDAFESGRDERLIAGQLPGQEFRLCEAEFAIRHRERLLRQNG